MRLELYGDLSSDGSTSLFQFHKGAIRTAQSALFAAQRGNFNSIKVRLEHSDSKDNSDSDSNFNSIKVRLERRRKTKNRANNPFQFHKGAIRT